jgi:hypothetical protein
MAFHSNFFLCFLEYLWHGISGKMTVPTECVIKNVGSKLVSRVELQRKPLVWGSQAVLEYFWDVQEDRVTDE